MNTIILTTGLLILIAILIVLWRVFLLSNKRDQKMQDLANTYKNQIVDLNKEVSRQNIIINDYKEKLKFKTESVDNKISTFASDENIDKLQEVLSDKQILEKEKEAFKIKNRRLWEQSLAIHKEKERIDLLRKYIESEHANLTKSITYALRIQQALLSSEELLKQIFSNHFILYRPRDIVSGDYYWVRQVNNQTFFVAADCTGHGVPGAFMSLLGISFLNEITGAHRQISAAQVLEEMREKVKASFKRDDGNITIMDGMDMVVCVFDHNTRVLEFSGANNGIFIARNDKTLVEVKGTKNPISFYRKEKPFENHTFQMQANESVFMYSDGYFDQFGGEKKQKITRKRFSAILQDCLDKGLPMQEIRTELEAFLDDWKGDTQQIDDILVFGVTCFGEDSEMELF